MQYRRQGGHGPHYWRERWKKRHTRELLAGVAPNVDPQKEAREEVHFKEGYFPAEPRDCAVAEPQAQCTFAEGAQCLVFSIKYSVLIQYECNVYHSLFNL